MASSQAATHSPQSTQLLWLSVTVGYGVPARPMRAASSFSSALSGLRASSSCMTPRRTRTAFGLPTRTARSRRTG